MIHIVLSYKWVTLKDQRFQNLFSYFYCKDLNVLHTHTCRGTHTHCTQKQDIYETVVNSYLLVAYI